MKIGDLLDLENIRLKIKNIIKIQTVDNDDTLQMLSWMWTGYWLEWGIVVLTVTKCSSNIKKLDLNFYGSKKDLIQCICLLLKVAREEGIL